MTEIEMVTEIVDEITTVDVTTKTDEVVDVKDESDIELKVAATTDTKKLGSSIASLLGRYPSCRLLAIGAGAVNQAIKGVAVSDSFIESSGYYVVVRPSFTRVLLDSVEKTGIRMLVERVKIISSQQQ